MTERLISDLVTDWGGFEKLVARLHETGGVSVEHNVTLPGRSGAPRQIDVLVRHTEGLYEHLIVVECKFWRTPVERLHVDALATTIREVGAARGVIFSTQGFQSGAITQAQHENISLFLLREPTDAEWGLPGRHVDIWVHCISFSIGDFQMPGASASNVSPGRQLKVNIQIGDPAHMSVTRIKAEGKPDATLEALVMRIARETIKAVYQPVYFNFDGKFDGDIRRRVHVNFEPAIPTLVFIDCATIIAPRITFDLGLRVNQVRHQIDRGAPYAFVLAVENCISKTVKTASRPLSDEYTHLAPVVAQDKPEEQIFQNGSIITVWIDAIEPWVDFAELEPEPGPELKLKLVLN